MSEKQESGVRRTEEQPNDRSVSVKAGCSRSLLTPDFWILNSAFRSSFQSGGVVLFGAGVLVGGVAVVVVVS